MLTLKYAGVKLSKHVIKTVVTSKNTQNARLYFVDSQLSIKGLL